MSTTYAERYHTDPSITDDELTPAVPEEIGRKKHAILQAVLPHWEAITGDTDQGVLALELEPLTPDFIRALAKALK